MFVGHHTIMSFVAKLVLRAIAVATFVNLSLSLDEFPKLFDVKNFDDYLQQTGRVYTDPKEREFRESIFLAKKTYIEMGNKYAAKGQSSFQMHINPLADMTHTEIQRLYGSKISIPGE